MHLLLDDSCILPGCIVFNRVKCSSSKMKRVGDIALVAGNAADFFFSMIRIVTEYAAICCEARRCGPLAGANGPAQIPNPRIRGFGGKSLRGSTPRRDLVGPP